MVTKSKQTKDTDPVVIARNIRIIDIFRMFDVPVKETRCLIRCYRPKNHKHGDEHPSMLVDPLKNRARCFVCDNRYLDSIDIAKHLGNYSFMEAVRFLSKKNFTRYKPAEKKPKEDDFEKIATSEKIDSLNITPKIKRFIDQQNIDYQSFNPDITPQMIDYHCNERGIDIDVLLKAGIRELPDTSKMTAFQKIKKQTDTYNVAIPYRKLFESNGDVLFYNLRSYKQKEDGKKELIANGSPICTCFSTPGCFMSGQIVIVSEGYIDALTMASRGLQSISVPAGISSFRKAWIEEFKKKKLIPIIAFDSEPAANNKAYEILNWMLNEDVIGYRLLLPNDEDLNSFFLNHERAMTRLSFLDTPVTDASSATVGNIKWNFNKQKQKYLFGGWESRYLDKHY